MSRLMDDSYRTTSNGSLRSNDSSGGSVSMYTRTTTVRDNNNNNNNGIGSSSKFYRPELTSSNSSGSNNGSSNGSSSNTLTRVDSIRRNSIMKAADISKQFDALIASSSSTAAAATEQLTPTGGGAKKQNSFDVESGKETPLKIPARILERKASFNSSNGGNSNSSPRTTGNGSKSPFSTINNTTNEEEFIDPSRISYTPTNTVQRKLQRKMSMQNIDTTRDGDMNYNDLQAIEKQRMEYRHFSFIEGKELLMRFADTVLIDIVEDAIFWISGMVYILVKLLLVYGCIPHDTSPMVSVSTLGGFISFLLVFFLNECYLRYKAQYLEQIKGLNTIVSIAEYANSFMSNKDRVLQLIRYLNVAHIVAYTGMTELYAESNLLVPMVSEFNLLTRKELELIRSFDTDDDGKGSLTCVIYWAHDVIRQAAQASEISTKARANITQHIELLRQTMFLMFSYQELSVPFNYIHLVELLSTIYCPLFAMAVALRGVTHVGMIADVLVIMIVTVFITGVYRIARKLQDAIGGDVEDLSVITTCRECIKLCKVIEQLPTMPIHDPSIERRLELGQEIF